MEVRIIEENKKDFLDLLLLADEQEDMIDRYLDRGTLFALYDNDLYDNESYDNDSNDNDSNDNDSNDNDSNDNDSNDNESCADRLRSICVVTDEGGGTFEIQSLATYPAYQRKGYGRYLIDYVCNHYRDVNEDLNTDLDTDLNADLKADLDTDALAQENDKPGGVSMILGTGDVPGILAFYEKSDFTVSHRLENYFIEHYKEPMFEDGVRLIDKIYLKRIL